MTTFADKVEPRYSWSQIEAAILGIHLDRFVAGMRFGVSAEDGCRIARAQMADDVRRSLQDLVPPKLPPTPGV